MTAELIAVGTELLLGQIVNTNAQFIAQGLRDLGICCYYQTVVGDNPARLRQAVEIACSRADIVITTGGLGPTVDDLTRETLASCFTVPLVLHAPSLAAIEAYFARLGRTMTPNNRKQAMLPDGCTVFDNPHGTAPGCAFFAADKHVLLLPGPPSECQPMWQTHAMPYLARLSDGCLVSRVVRVFGMGESTMESLLHEQMASMTNPTLAPYAGNGECCVRLTARAATPAQAQALLAPATAEVLQTLGEAVYGVDVDSLEQVVGNLLRARGLTLAVAESCTGGLLSKRLTDLAGCSDYYLGGVCAYHNAVKERVLGVSADTLRTHGAVSPEVAAQMAKGVAQALGADLGIGITGVAGPQCSEQKPVGLVYLSLWQHNTCITRTLRAAPPRDRIRFAAASAALNLVRTQLCR